MPGFGRSDKPLDASYSFRFFDRVLSGFLDAVGVERLGLAVHDLGGPVGLYWASQHPERVSELALLNTLVFARPSWAVIAFVASARIPGIRSWLTSPAGDTLRDALGRQRQEPPHRGGGRRLPGAFRHRRRAQGAAQGRYRAFIPAASKEVERWLPSIEAPVRILYGERDRILPDVAKTMRKVAERVPQAELSTLPDCGHFCQEERPGEIGEALARFFGHA